jgi:hypothetical protein
MKDMPRFVVVTETVVRRAYEVDADGPEAAKAMFGWDIEDDGSVLDEEGEEILWPVCGESTREILECRLCH